MHNRIFFGLIFWMICFGGSAVQAQISTSATPPSALHASDALSPPTRITVPSPDSSSPTTNRPSAAARSFAPIPSFQYGHARPVHIDLKQTQNPDRLPNGDRIWRIAITSAQARAVRLRFDAFRLPPGAQLFTYDPDRRITRGAFTDRNHKPDSSFATDFTPGSTVIVEYIEPPAPPFSGQVQIGGLVHADRLPRQLTGVARKQTQSGSALACSINTACPPAEGWSDQARATVLIDRGGSTCSGVLLNNVQEDETPYVLTANHCGGPAVGDVVDWVFTFNFASTTCADPASPPESPSLVGATVRVSDSYAQSDVLLLELSEPIPPSYNARLAGWSIESGLPDSSVVLGHPRSDIRKITFEHDTLLDYSTRWIATFDEGTIESGSSGSPLFNDAHQVIGHVSGALNFDPASCSGPGGDDNAPTISHPKLSYNWMRGDPGARLSDFLDPQDTGVTSLNGIDADAGDTSMPVELTDFEVVRDGDTAALRWRTASETNNAGFALQHRRPNDASASWTERAFIHGAGTTTTPQTYRYVVDNLAPGTHAFRLKQVDYDGTTQYSPTVELTIDAREPTVSAVAPHPVRGRAAFTVTVDRPQQVRIDLVDMLGRRVLTLHDGWLPNGPRRRISIPARRLASGLYVLHIRGETFRTSRRVTVVR